MKYLRYYSLILLTWIGLSGLSLVWAQSRETSNLPSGYYDDAKGKSGYELKTALHHIIDNHTDIGYKSLWDAFRDTDKTAGGKVWDMYSDCSWTFGGDQCGNYKDECDCYNREHSFPKSWFDEASPMYSDLFHLYPTDGKVNGMRSNLPFGEVGSATYTSNNGSKVGQSITPGFGGKVFEPVDEYKGDFARSYFYMATRYEDRIANWRNCPVCNGTTEQSFSTWAVNLLLKWHRQDPVSQKEIDRNQAVYGHQRNRNPFIDYPELAEKIWGDDSTPFNPDGSSPEPEEDVYTMPYAYFTSDGVVMYRDTLKVYPSESSKAKALTLTLLFPRDGEEVYNENIAARVSLSGFSPSEVDGEYSLVSYNLPSGENYLLEVGLDKNGVREVSAQSNFTVLDTVSIKPSPAPGDETDYMFVYEYKEAGGVTLNLDTLYVSEKKVTTRTERNSVLSSDLLWEEDFANLFGADNSGAPASSDKCDYVQSFEDKVYAVNSGVRIASGSENGAVVFKEFQVDGDFDVTVSGKGWDSDELTATLECVGCTQASQKISFTKDKGSLPSGKYEDLEPIRFSPSQSGEKITLKVRASSKKRIFLGKVSVNGKGGGSVPEPDPDDFYQWSQFRFESPRQGEELLLASVSPRLALSDKNAEGSGVFDYLRMPEQELQEGKAYSLRVELWQGGEKLDDQTVGFSVRKEVSNLVVDPVRIQVYPNPSGGNFYVELPVHSRMEIYTSTGRLVKVREDVSGQQEVNLQMPGLYLLRVVKDGNWAVKRIVVR